MTRNKNLDVKPSRIARVSRRLQGGFTLVELVVGILIIGILATIAVVAYNKVITNANQTHAKANLTQFSNLALATSVSSNAGVFSMADFTSSLNHLGATNGSSVYQVFLATAPSACGSATPFTSVGGWTLCDADGIPANDSAFAVAFDDGAGNSISATGGGRAAIAITSNDGTEYIMLMPWGGPTGLMLCPTSGVSPRTALTHPSQAPACQSQAGSGSQSQSVDPPTNLSVTPAATSLNLSWTASGNATAYSVYIDNNLVPTCTAITQTSCNITSLTTGSTHALAVRGSIGSSVSDLVTASAIVISAPANLHVTATGDGTLDVAWDASTGATGYNVLVDGSNVGSCQNISSTTCHVDSLLNNISHTVSVEATAGGWTTARSDVSGTPEIPLVAPTVTVTPGSTLLNVSWATVPGATSYQVYKDAVAYGIPVVVTSNTVSGLTNGTAYSITVKALRSAETSTASSSVSSTPFAPASAVLATAGNASASLSWTAGAGATGYTVSLSPSNGSCVVTGVTAACTGLTNGTSYTASVVSTNSGHSSTSVTASFTSFGPPSSLSATAGNASVSLSWSAGAGATGYTVSLSPSDGSCSVSGTTASCSGLTNGTSYTASVVSTNSGNNSSSVTATFTPFGSPSGLGIMNGNTKLQADWTAAPGATGYNVYASGTLKCSNTSSTTCMLTGLTNGTSYTVSVYAVRGGVEGGYVTGTGTPSAIITGVVIDSYNTSSVTLHWNPQAGATSYKVYKTGSVVPSCNLITATSCTITGLVGNATYNLQVSYMEGSESTKTTVLSFIAMAAPVLGTPAQGAVNSRIIYVPSTGVPANNYKAYYRVHGTTTWTFHSTTSSNYYTMTMPTKGVNYDIAFTNSYPSYSQETGYSNIITLVAP